MGNSFSELFSNAKNRILVATFASNIHRIQQIINASINSGRKVAISGRSMVNVINVASELGYLTIPDNVIIDIDSIDKYPANKITIITTGSQGEAMSALTRMASSSHRKVDIMPGDTVIFLQHLYLVMRNLFPES